MDRERLRVKGSLGIYMHVPFCVSKCPYCDFASVAGNAIPEERYIKCLLRELGLRSDRLGLRGKTVDTVYFGGGTPSILTPDSIGVVLGHIKDNLAVSPSPEITIEANPDTVDHERLRAFRDAGVTRLSIGIQSLSGKVLNALGRTHDAERALKAFCDARSAGFESISIDLMFGAPGQTMEEWEDTLVRAARLGPEHISMYGLTIEEGSAFYRGLGKRPFLSERDEVNSAEMYSLGIRLLKDSGYSHYEISNLARQGFECRHNLKYWLSEDYLGIGASAHSFVSGRWGRRSWNERDVKGYMEALEDNGDPASGHEDLNMGEALTEAMMLGLRMPQKGIEGRPFRTRFGVWPRDAFKAIDALIEQGLLCQEGEGLFLTTKGILLSNEVFARLSASSPILSSGPIP